MSVYKLPDGRFQARWYDPDKRQRARIFPTKREAEDHLAEIRTGKKQGTYRPARSVVTVAQYAQDSWLPGLLDLRPNSADTYSQHVVNHIIPAWGRRPIASIDHDDAKRFVRALSQHLAPSTVSTVHAVAHGLFAAAVASGLAPANPCTGVRLPEVIKPVVEPMPTEHVLALAEAITPRYELAVWLAAGAGLREGEALGVTVPRLDFLRRRVRVLEQIQRRQLVPLKTRSSRRNVPLDDLVLGKATAHMARWEPGPHNLIITNSNGDPVQRNSFGDRWRAAVKAAGLKPGTRFHDLRHFYASTLIAAGVHPKIIQERLGHKHISETMDTYGHLFPDAQDAGRGVIDAAFAQRPVKITMHDR